MSFFCYFYNMKTEELHISNIRGLKLAARLYIPDSAIPRYYSVFAHCFTCSKELKAIGNIAETMTSHSIALMSFDMTGIGESEGNFSDTNLTTQIEDILSVSKFMESNYRTPRLLIGHSIGGCAVIFAALKLSYVNAVCTIASPAEPSSLSKKLNKTRQKALAEGYAETEIGGKKYTLRDSFFKDIENYNMASALKKLNRPYLIMHSPSDNYTDIRNAGIIFGYAKHPKSFICLDGIDHLMLKPHDAKYIGNIIACWAGRYIKNN